LRVHFIGIGGTGMGALAGLLKRAGHDVRGSDLALYPPMSTQLSDAGVPVLLGYSADNLDWGPERVVVGNICGADHVEVQAAKARQIPPRQLPLSARRAAPPWPPRLVVAGTHGKTTTTSICAWILRYAGRDPSFLIAASP
jgi:UDP-N-acetylmuramate: L-alanyl-gamma-D-glutamyl-meso-diaminopimelate ligase